MAPSPPCINPVPMNIWGKVQGTLELRHYDRVGKQRIISRYMGSTCAGQEEKETMNCVQEHTKLGNAKRDQ